MWDIPGPGIESMSPALADKFLNTRPPGMSYTELLITLFLLILTTDQPMRNAE